MVSRDVAAELCVEFHGVYLPAWTHAQGLAGAIKERERPSLNRKNTLFVGSDRGGDWAATMFSICQCCRLVGIDPYRYICDIFAELHTGRKDYANLRPKAWAGRLVARSA
jgi:hypothetical protein